MQFDYKYFFYKMQVNNILFINNNDFNLK